MTRAQLRALKRAPTPQETYEVVLKDKLEGFHLTMRAMSGRQIVAIQRGTMTEADVIEMVADRCVAHNFEEELLDLDFWIIGEILDRWGEAIQETVLPPANGAS